MNIIKVLASVDKGSVVNRAVNYVKPKKLTRILGAKAAQKTRKGINPNQQNNVGDLV